MFAYISHARLSDNKTELALEGKLVYNTLLHSIRCITHYITLHYIAYHYIVLLYFIRCTASHYIALFMLLHNIVCILQGKSQFAHKGESSNWGKTRNMGGDSV